MCPLISGSFTHHQGVILRGHQAIVTFTNREKSSGLTYPYGKGAPLSPTHKITDKCLSSVSSTRTRDKIGTLFGDV